MLLSGYHGLASAVPFRQSTAALSPGFSARAISPLGPPAQHAGYLGQAVQQTVLMAKMS